MVTLSFDDAWASQYTNALPILKASGLPATFYFISEVIQNNSNFPGYMTPAMATTIANAGYEIADHTVTHPDLTTLSSTQVTNEITASRTYLQNLTGKPITDIAYPYGAVNTTVKNLVKQAGYTVARGVDDGQLNIPSSDKYNLFGQCVENTESLATIESWINKAKANKQWYILCFHEIGSTPDQYNISTSEFQQILNYIKSSGVQVVTVAQGRAMMGN
jgi:peptidoglycan/xylan/chitin deacetylase (PgdA/CDA1 family)